MHEQLTILVIEDSEDDFYLLQETIEASDEIDAKLVQAVRLTDALAMTADHEPHLVIVDLHLPDSSGLDTFVLFHQHYPQIPAVIMTGAKDRKMAYEAVQKGAQDYLYKGESSPSTIARTIRFAIERHRLRVELQSALDNVKQLQGLLPICSFCKKVRNDSGYWDQIESYISAHAEVQFSHGLCPECGKAHYGKYYQE